MPWLTGRITEAAAVIPMAPDVCYPEMARIAAWAKVVPAEFPGYFGLVPNVVFGSLLGWLLLLSVFGLLIAVFVFVGLPRVNRNTDGALYTFFLAGACSYPVVFFLPAVYTLGWSDLVDLVGGSFTLGLFSGIVSFIASVFATVPFSNRSEKFARKVRQSRREGGDALLRFLRSRWPWVDTVHKDAFGKLVRTRLGWEGQWLWAVVVRCPTSGKEYALVVDEGLRRLSANGVPFGESQKQTAKNAVASTFGFSGDEYVPEVQT